MARVSVADILAKKKRGEKIVMLTAYDYPLGFVLDQSGVDIILVGDSLANVALGLPSTRDVDMETMIHHAKAVRRGVERALLVGDMPYSACQDMPTAEVVRHAWRFIREAGCEAVKMEWHENCLEATERMAAAGIPVMGHVGLTPQTAEQMGGFKVQGRSADAALKILEQAKALEARGCFSVVLECLPEQLGEVISKELEIPAISCGAGRGCDGQVLVTHDLVGLTTGRRPKFAKQYVAAGELIQNGVQQFIQDVLAGRYPDSEHSYLMDGQEWEKFLRHCPRVSG